MKQQQNISPFSDEAAYWQAVEEWGSRLLDCCEARRMGDTRREAECRKEAAACWQLLPERSAASAESGVFLPLPYLEAVFSLDELEAQCLALAFLPQQQREMAARYQALEPAGGGALTLGLALALLGRERSVAVRSMLEPGGLLRDYCLEVTDAGLDSCLRPCWRLVSFVLAGGWEDPGMPGLLLCPPVDKQAFPARLLPVAEQMERYLAETDRETVTFLLTGLTGSGRRSLARLLESRLGQPLLMADGRELTGPDGAVFRRAMMREALIQRCPVCLTGLDDELETAAADSAASDALAALLGEISAPSGHSFLVTESPWPGGNGRPDWRLIPVALPLPGLEESSNLWGELLARYPLWEAIDPDQLAGRYRLTPGQMGQALDTALALARWRGLSGIDQESLNQGCRSQFRHSLGNRARRVETVFGWEDLVLPQSAKRLLRSACDQMKYRRQVMDSWGFGKRLAYGSGLSMLFSGPPGTGKTMAAQIAAGELGLELYKVELSAVVSKYVGETEKNLNEIFREASRSQAVLFFDEADVLFGKRTEVKDAHDKYNNMEAAYLLQKIEEYDGVSILATNFLQNFDEAFKRRLKFIISFPFPDARYRLRLWQKVFPPETPLEPDIDWDFLAEQFELTGSNIKNVAVNAAYLAAGEGQEVGMAHLLTAIRRELFKTGKLLSREDFGAYYMLAEEDIHADL